MTVLAPVTLHLHVFSLFLHACVGCGWCDPAPFPTKALWCQGSAAWFPGEQSWPLQVPVGQAHMHRFYGLYGLAHNTCKQQLAKVGGRRASLLPALPFVLLGSVRIPWIPFSAVG